MYSSSTTSSFVYCINVWTRTIRNWLHAIGLYSLIPMIFVTLAAIHFFSPRKCATEHVNWRKKELRRIRFSDEIAFFVHIDSRRVFSSGRAMVYAGIPIDGYTDITLSRSEAVFWRLQLKNWAGWRGRVTTPNEDRHLMLTSRKQ